ncbi:MAG: hypothetical protein AAGN66_27275 [Acidobacteriota bacterium]
MKRPSTSRRRLPSLRWLGLALFAAFATGGCATTAVQPGVEARQAVDPIPETELLDVDIQIFDPGLPEGSTGKLEDEGIFEDLRRSEARYIPVELMETLQATGQWGAVRVVPEDSQGTDLVVSGTIVESTGQDLVVEVRAVDARGVVWLEKTYRQEADPWAYRDGEGVIDREPFRSLYNQIANDLVVARRPVTSADLLEIRRVAQLRFAADIAPAAFGDHLERNRKGHLVAARLPADGDPMVARVDQVRERDALLVDTLTEHYANFHAQMEEPYANWRRYSYEEELARAKVKKQAWARKIAGGLLLLGAILSDPDTNSGAAARDLAVIGGIETIRSGISKGQEAKIHVEALRELAASFDSEVTPLLVDVEGETRELSGSAEAQYAAWRQMLRDLFIEETGLAVDPDTGEPILPSVAGQ